MAIPVTLAPAVGAEAEASGLAHMLHQFLEQTLAASPEKRRLARKLRGEAIFRAAEDEAICVRIRFRGDCIELGDSGEGGPASAPSVTADFLTIAHLTSGQESPFALVARRKLRVRFRLGEIAFLLRMLAFMRIANGRARRAWLWQAVLAGVALAAAIYLLVRA
jgi:hypothetical protein